jgi:hypothetical protein
MRSLKMTKTENPESQKKRSEIKSTFFQKSNFYYILTLSLLTLSLLAGWCWSIMQKQGLYGDCANHFIQLKMGFIYSSKLKPDLILPATDNTVEALKKIYTESGATDNADFVASEWCPESKARGDGIGYIYIGDGLKLKDVVDKNILILFCPGENHRGWWSGQSHGLYKDGMLCAKTNQDMLKELKNALKRGESGEVPYSPRAMDVLRAEIKKREK